MERNPIQELKVGCFVVVFVAIVTIATFILGGGTDMLARRYTLQTSYADVKGLKAGAVVRLAGIDVGEVSKVILVADADGKNVHVQLSIKSEYQERITEDSVAGISSVGVLGDMFVSLSVGSSEKRVLKDMDSIGSSEPLDFVSYADRATAIVDNAANISHKVDLLLGPESQAKNGAVGDSLEHLEAMLDEAKNGEGILHVLFYDKQAGRKVDAILANVEGITGDVSDITMEVRDGNGLAHAVIYGEDGEKLTASLNELAADMGGLVDDIKTKDSLAHSLLYDPDQAKLVEELHGTMSNLQAMTDSVNAGEGTLGLLVKDPQLYEDLRLLFGGAQRNALLRAYVRSTVAKARSEEGDAWRAPTDDPNNGGK